MGKGNPIDFGKVAGSLCLAFFLLVRGSSSCRRGHDYDLPSARFRCRVCIGKNRPDALLAQSVKDHATADLLTFLKWFGVGSGPELSSRAYVRNAHLREFRPSLITRPSFTPSIAEPYSLSCSFLKIFSGNTKVLVPKESHPLSSRTITSYVRL